MKKLIIILVSLLLASSAEALPSRYDLRENGYITSVKSQGIPGPCWAFAALGSMESNYLVQRLNTDKKKPDLSEMQLAFYTYKGPNPEKNFTPRHSSGTLSLEGNSFKAIAFLSRLAGPTDEKNLPYTTTIAYEQRQALAKKTPESYKRTMRLHDAYFLSGRTTIPVEKRKELIMKHGAIAVSIYSDIFKYKIKGKYFTYFNNSEGTKTDHEVLLAGWDDNFPRDRFSPQPSRNGAWLVKNSWGTMRGHNGGYFWTPYEQFMKGGTAFIAAKNNPRLKHYGYDDLGFCSSVNYSWAANIFRISSKREILNEAAFYTPSNNSSYEVYVYSLGKKVPSSPISGKLLSSVKGVKEFAGYHTVDLPERLLLLNEGEYFSVVLKLSGGVMPVETRFDNYSENARVNEKESYFSRDGKTWTDGIKINANPCIKAFTEIL